MAIRYESVSKCGDTPPRFVVLVAHMDSIIALGDLGRHCDKAYCRRHFHLVCELPFGGRTVSYQAKEHGRSECAQETVPP